MFKHNFFAPKDHKMAIVLLLITAIIWGLAPPIIKKTVEYIPPLTFLMIRFWISAIVLLPFTIHIFRKYKLNLDRLNKIITSSFLGHILALGLLFLGIQSTDSISTSMIFAFSPILVLALGFFILKEVINKNEIEGTLLAFVGTLVIIFSPLLYKNSQNLLPTNATLGNILIFLAVIFDGLYIIYTKKYISQDKIINPLVLVTLSFTFAAIVFTPLGLLEQYLNINHIGNSGPKYCIAREIEDLSCDDFGCFEKPQEVGKEVATSRGFEISPRLRVGTWVGYRDIALDNLYSKPPNYLCIHDTRIQYTDWQIFKMRLASYFYPPTILGIIYMSLFSGIIAYLLYQYALRNVDASESAVYTYLQPIFGLPMAYFLLAEVPTPLFILGAIIIAFGIYRAERK